jgi:hypothetical protein
MTVFVFKKRDWSPAVPEFLFVFVLAIGTVDEIRGIQPRVN